LSHARCAIKIEVDSTRLRPSDIPEMRCDARKFQTATGWQPHIPFEQSLLDLLEYERKNLTP
jgi:nucleoside-diphosphate-sugar epimerase